MVKKIIGITFIVILVGAVLFFAINGSANKDETIQTETCQLGEIVDKALAVGTIVPRHEIAVKSKISGIVKEIYADIGDEVHIGDPLINIAPDPTPLEYAESKRQHEIAQVTFEKAKRDMDRFETLKEKKLISDQEFENIKSAYDEAQLRMSLAEERLALIEKGQTTIASVVVENVIKSPVDGTVLVRNVNVGDPVVPLTSYQAGTEVMSLADMSDLIFKGTVDEIDVGKLDFGMPVEITIGALPNVKIEGELTKVSPKAQQNEGTTVFEIEINLKDSAETNLRAGYSANADIIIVKKTDILLIPERLIEFVEDSAFVEIQDSLGIITKKAVELGLSDGINIEVVDGLQEGEILVERPPKEITGDL